jgi:Ca-activated chloride channel family protein
VLSRFTAFLAIDRSQVVNAGGQLEQIVQPVDMPAGWDMQLEGGGGGGTRGGAPIALPPKIKAKCVMVGAPSANASAVRGRFASPAELSRKKLPLRKPASGPMQPGAKDAKAVNLPHQPKGKLEIADDGFEAERSIAMREQGGSAPAGRSAYHAKLEVLARELARASDPNAIRAIRQRLTEWIEDVRSVGGHDDLAAAVEKLVQRLSAALTEAAAVATELQKLASGASAPPKAPKSKSDRAFWK